MILNRINLIKVIIVIGIAALVLGCFSGGTHGSIKSYSFLVSKERLQTAVNGVIRKESDLRIAPIKDTFVGKYYNDGEYYITLDIGDSSEFNEYIFQFVGDKKYWDTAHASQISVAYAYDKNGNGGSIGNGQFSSCSAEVQQAIIKLFERRFIDKVDSALNYK